MAMRGPLRRELGNYRRGRSGVMPGFRGRKQYVTGAVSGPVYGGYPTDLYMWNTPRNYHPNMNAPAVQSHEYVTDPDWQSHHVPLSHQEKLFLSFPERESAERSPDYERTRAFGEFFLKAMEAQYRPFADGEEVPTLAKIWDDHFAQEDELDRESVDHADGLADIEAPPDEMQEGLPDLADIADALGHLQNVFPEGHPDIVNLRAAAHEILQHPELLPQPEDFRADWSESRLGSSNPYEADLIDERETHEMPHSAEGLFEQHEAAFEQEMQTLGDVLGASEFGPDPMSAMEMEPTAGIDATLEPMDEYPEPDSLEHIVDQDLSGPMELVQGLPDAMEPAMQDPLAANPYGLAPEDQINQAMDQAAGLAPQEPEPDPYMVAQQMFDEQMQYMANPFMMPGMGPMPGPAPGM